MIPPNCLEVHINNSHAPFIVSGYSYLPTQSGFIRYSNSCPYIYSSSRSKKNHLDFYSSFITSFGVAVSPTLSVALKLHIMCFPPDSIKFCSQELDLSKYSSFVSVGPLSIVTNEMICYIRYSLGFLFTSTTAMIFFTS